VLQVAQHTAWLSPEHRAIVDVEIAPRLAYLGNRQMIDLTKQIAYRLDPRSYLDRLAHAETERHVSTRPAPDCMVYLTALLPVTQGVSVRAALEAHASIIVGVGAETRTRGQVMADTLIERVTSQTTAGNVAVTVNLIMTDTALFGPAGNGHATDGHTSTGPANTGEKGAGDEPAILVGAGVIPAETARRLARDPTGDSAVFLRRLYTHPETGHLAAMDSQARLFTQNQRLFLMLRDQTCRTPYCDAPIRHADHVQPHEDGGPTTIANGQGLCEVALTPVGGHGVMRLEVLPRCGCSVASRTGRG
jgi:hypothetical protein